MKYPGSLHNHTDYSNLRLRDCINKVADIMNYAVELGHTVFALTDHEATSGWVKAEKLYKKIKEKNPEFKLVRGNEIYLCRDGLNAETWQKEDKYYHFILLAKDLIGAKQIMELSTKAWHRSYIQRGMRRVPTYYSDLEEIIGANPGHVIGSTACLGGMLGTKLMEYGKTDNTELYRNISNWILAVQNIFSPGNFYLELQPSAAEEQEYVNKELLKLSKKLNVPYIITCDTHYKSKEKREIHKAYLNSQDGDREVDAFYATTYLMDTEELESYLKYMTREELDEAYHNIEQIQQKCEDYSILKPLRIPRLNWKPAPYLSTATKDKWFKLIPELFEFYISDFEGDKLLAELVIERMEDDITLQNQETYDAVNECLNMTRVSSEKNNVHWSSYYLNLQGIIDTCWEAGSIVGPGRGSGVGFILLYILGVTQINPLRETTKTFAWRFLNPDRVSVLDVDFDISGLKRAQVLRAFREKYGENRVANVATFGTEKSKSSILTAARGLGIDVDEAQYIASFVPADRGQLRTLHQCYYGDEENDYAPVKEFVRLMKNEYKELWNVAQEIEGLISRVGIHAGGIIFVDEPFYESCGLMRAPDGTIITQFDLHDAEDVSLIKYDALSVEACDKIQITLELLQKDGYIEKDLSLKEMYEKYVGIYNLERDAKDMWKMVWEHKILSLFQMEQQSGVQGIALTKPENVDDLATLNSVIRLMAQEKGGEQPLNKYARFKNNINLWYKEMDSYGLTKAEQKLLEPILKISYGICESQERFMQLVQLPECGGFDLTWSDSLRKSIAKKNPAAYLELEKEYFKVTKEKDCSENLCNYVWKVLIATSRGYGFNLSHTLAYSLVALQEMNLAYKFPIIYWNCANLIVNSGALEDNSEEEMVDIFAPESDDMQNGVTFTDLPNKAGKIRKTASTNYEKLATAIGKIREAGIKVSLVDVNRSDFGFKPDVENNQILFGLKGLVNVNDELIRDIIQKRPYNSIADFMTKVNPKKQSMLSLIKGGGFDWYCSRENAMIEYIWAVCDKKKRLTLQNLPGLMRYGLIPDDFKFEIPKRVYEFNRYLKTVCKYSDEYLLDDRAVNFLVEIEKENLIYASGNKLLINAKAWDKVYQGYMDTFREWIAADRDGLLNTLNNTIFLEDWAKYGKNGNISAWEMEVLCFYYHDHELVNVDKEKYGLVEFSELPETPAVEQTFKRGESYIPIYKLYRICGTCIAKNKTKATVTLLTTSGVVTIKLRKEHFNVFDKQLSIKNPDGTKTIVEKSWFNRGNMLVVQGYRRGDEFITKKYAASQGHQLYRIDSVEPNGEIILRSERKQGEEDNEED